MRIYIYIFEFPNGKYYIGQTKDFISRWKNHRLCHGRNGHKSLVDYAIRKYGWDAIKPKVLIICDSTMANFFEERAILHYKTINRKYGYNILIGGNASTTAKGRYLKSKQIRKPILRYDTETGFFEKWYPNLLFAARDNGTSDTSIAAVLSDKCVEKTLYKKIFIYDSYSRPKRLDLTPYKRKIRGEYNYRVWRVYDCDLNKILEPCHSLKALAKQLNVALQTIKNSVNDACTIRYKFLKRYFMIRYDTREMPQKEVEIKFQEIIDNYIPLRLRIGKSIEVTSKDSKEILEFNSAAEAARSLSFNEKYVRRAASRERHKTGYYKGYYFNYISQ